MIFRDDSHTANFKFNHHNNHFTFLLRIARRAQGMRLVHGTGRCNSAKGKRIVYRYRKDRHIDLIGAAYFMHSVLYKLPPSHHRTKKLAHQTTTGGIRHRRVLLGTCNPRYGEGDGGHRETSRYAPPPSRGASTNTGSGTLASQSITKHRKASQH